MASNLPPLAQATSGSLGSVVSNALVFPLDTVVKRLQTTKRRRSRPALERARSAAKLGRPVGPKTGSGGYDSFLGAIRTIFSQEGLAGFYSGLSVDSLSTLLSQFIYFFAYTALRNRLQLRKQRLATNPQSGKKAAANLLSPLEELGIGCLAGVVAKGIVSPLSMITVRAQTSREPRKEAIGGLPGDDAPLDPAAAKKRPDDSDSDESDAGYSSSPSAITIAKEIYSEKGLAGFWSGFQSTVILVRHSYRPFALSRQY